MANQNEMLNILWRQKNLRTYYGYYLGPINGADNTQLKDAVRRFQKGNGLAVDGIYGVKTNDKLIACIKDLQELLSKHGYNLSVDGKAGDKTINAIKDFQKKNGLTIDGIAGTKTFAKLRNSSSTNSKPSSSSWSGITHFKKSEFACKDGCGFDDIDTNLVRVLERIRSHFGGKPIIITSGCRCAKHNKAVGGVQGSRHVLGKAADFYIKGVSTSQVLAYCKQLVKEGVLRYTYTGGYKNGQMDGIVHIDIN